VWPTVTRLAPFFVRLDFAWVCSANVGDCISVRSRARYVLAAVLPAWWWKSERLQSRRRLCVHVAATSSPPPLLDLYHSGAATAVC